MPARSSTLAVVGLLFAACAAEPDRDPELPPITWTGPHLDYAPQPHAEPICRGTPPYMDRYLELAAAAMHITLDGPVLYVHGSGDDEPFCERGAVGCTSIDGRIYSLMAPHEHELVHAARSFDGFSQGFFEEGAAEMFGDDARLTGRGPATGDLLEGIELAHTEDGSWYPRMGHFSAYLHDRHGREVTTAMLRETGPFSSTAQTLAVLETATAMPFDDLRADYEAEPACDQAHYRYPLYPCDAPEALRPRCEGDAEVRIEERIACDDPTTLGPRQAELWKYIAVDIPADGEYTISRAAEVAAPGSSITIKECSMRCDSILVEIPITGTYLDPDVLPGPPVFLRAGRYALRLTRPADAPSNVAVKILGTCGP